MKGYTKEIYIQALKMNKAYEVKDNLKEYGFPLLRIALALVFLWFSISQLIAPNDWTGYLPGFIQNIKNVDPIIFIYTNAIFELVFAVLLILGIFTKISAFLLGIHLLGISISLGWNAIAIRDYGLAFATLAIALNGPDRFCLKK